MIFRTPRLTLRPFRRADAPRISALIGDPRVAAMLADISLPFDVRTARQWLQPAWGDIRLAVVLEGEVIGGVAYHTYPCAIGGLGYWLGHAYWGQGYASEAAGAIVRAGFEQDRMLAFVSAHFLDNPASGRVLRRLGFVPSRPNNWHWCPARKAKVESVNYVLARAEAGYAPAHRTWMGWLGFHPWRLRNTLASSA